MKKKNTILIKLLSSANTGYFFVKKKNLKKNKNKLTFNKYDPIIKKHTLFKETKI